MRPLRMLSGSSAAAFIAVLVAATGTSAALSATYDVLIENGRVYDGTGGPSLRADVAIQGDRIVAIGDLSDGDAATVIDAQGLYVAPGFINMLSWATQSLIADGRSQSDIRQGVTLEVMGEGRSMGPLNDEMRAALVARQGDFKFDVPWTTLAEYLEFLEHRGVSPNVASFVGATSVRVHEIGQADRPPTEVELAVMQNLVREAMKEGAMGVGSSLIYAPAFYADTDELIALMRAAAEYGGMYISHMRSEGNRLLESVDELIEIAEASGAPAEIYHLKMSGQENWGKFDAVVEKIEAARARGTRITADMYTYPAGSTGLDAAMPPWVQEGGYAAWAERLADPEIREQLLDEMTTPTDEWENLMLAAGAEGTLLVGFKNHALRKYTGMTLAEVSEARGTPPALTTMDLVIEDGSRVQVIYFLMSEENVAKIVALPWVSFGSDAQSMATEGHFLNTSTHPRAYGNFARVLGKYVRDEAVLSMEAAIHKLSGLPAENLGIRQRGTLSAGNYADVVVFDPEEIRDHATFEAPHQYATGMVHVFVNGEQVLADGEHTGALPGRVVRGPGWVGWQDQEMFARIQAQQRAPDRHTYDFPRDRARKPFEAFQFLGVQEGMTALDVGAYAGYTTEMLAAAVGPEGRVYSHNTERVLERFADGYYQRTMTERLAGNRLPNVTLHLTDYEDLALTGEVDVAFLGNLLHDFYHDEGREKAVEYLTAIRATLKPGGVLGLTDHVGRPDLDNAKLHRMEEALARELLAEAGFEVVATSDLYANPADEHDLMVYDERVYRQTDRFFLKARMAED